MCDYSLTNVKSRPAVVADKLVVSNFGTGTNGFADGTEDEKTGMQVAVCLLPGTEIAFAEPVYIQDGFKHTESAFWVPQFIKLSHKVARFRQINKNVTHLHHDALEFPDGRIVLLTSLQPGQIATVLQLPAAPKTVEEAKEQERVAWAG